MSKFFKFLIFCVAEMTDLSLTWLQTQKTGFSFMARVMFPPSYRKGLLLYFNPFKPNGHSNPYQLEENITNFRVVEWYFSFLIKF